MNDSIESLEDDYGTALDDLYTEVVERATLVEILDNARYWGTSFGVEEDEISSDQPVQLSFNI